MPAGDGTGPAGMGPMTGRAAGYCAGYPAPGYMSPLPGRGMGFGRGLGRGFRGGRGWGGFGRGPFVTASYPYAAASPWYGSPYGAGPTREQEADVLKRQIAYFEDALEEIRTRLAEIDVADAESAGT